MGVAGDEVEIVEKLYVNRHGFMAPFIASIMTPVSQEGRWKVPIRARVRSII